MGYTANYLSIYTLIWHEHFYLHKYIKNSLTICWGGGDSECGQSHTTKTAQN